MPQVVVIVNSMKIPEIICEFSTVLELQHLSLTYDADEIFHRQLLTSIIYQVIVGKNYFHFKIRISKTKNSIEMVFGPPRYLVMP